MTLFSIFPGFLVDTLLKVFDSCRVTIRQFFCYLKMLDVKQIIVRGNFIEGFLKNYGSCLT